MTCCLWLPWMIGKHFPVGRLGIVCALDTSRLYPFQMENIYCRSEMKRQVWGSSSSRYDFFFNVSFLLEWRMLSISTQEHDIIVCQCCVIFQHGIIILFRRNLEENSNVQSWILRLCQWMSIDSWMQGLSSFVQNLKCLKVSLYSAHELLLDTRANTEPYNAHQWIL